LGEGHGFMCGWCYWINNVLYYPSLLISAAVVATFVTGAGDSKLGENSAYVITTTLVMLWIATAVNIVGVGTGKWLQNLGGIGTYIPGIIIILIGVTGCSPILPRTRSRWAISRQKKPIMIRSISGPQSRSPMQVWNCRRRWAVK